MCLNVRFKNAPLNWVCLVVLAVGMAGGCRNKPSIDFGAVSGQVKFEGKPLHNATVCFTPAGGRPSYAKTDADGQYSLTYMGEDWGAVLGTHRVVITTEDQIEDMKTGKIQFVRESLPKKYHAKTTLLVEVKGGKNVIDFDLLK